MSSYPLPFLVLTSIAFLAPACSEDKRAPVYDFSVDRTTMDAGVSDAGQGVAAHDCDSDSDCPDSRCVELRPGGFRACEQDFNEATTCTSDLDECCSTAECPAGWMCYDLRALGRKQPNEEWRQVCIGNICDSDADCSKDSACIREKTIGHANRQCIPARCRTDADCDPSEVCAPVEYWCGDATPSLECVGQRGCRAHTDCGDDQAPFGVGEEFCDRGDCAVVVEGTLCGLEESQLQSG